MWVAGFQFVVLSQAWFIHYTHFFPHFCLLRASFRAFFRHPSVRLYCLHCPSQSPTHSSCVFPLLGSRERKRKRLKLKINSTRLDSTLFFWGSWSWSWSLFLSFFVSSFLLLPSVIWLTCQLNPQSFIIMYHFIWHSSLSSIVLRPSVLHSSFHQSIFVDW